MQTSQVITIIVSVVVSNVTLLGGLILILHRTTNKRIDDFSKRFDDINERFNDINRQIDAIRADVRMILNYLLPENMQKNRRKR